MKQARILATVQAVLLVPALATAADNLKLNPHLNYAKNGWQGFLITADHLDSGLKKGVPNLIYFYADYCYNSKRVARSVVDLYGKYQGRVNFVPIDVRTYLDSTRMDLAKAYFRGGFPHVTILDRNGKVVFDYTGEVPENIIEGWLQAAMRREGGAANPTVAAGAQTADAPADAGGGHR